MATGWWAEVFFAKLAATAQRATAALLGEQPYAGPLAATAQRATAALVGEQPEAGLIAAQAQRATAALTGTMQPAGILAAQARIAAAALAGGQTQQGTIAATAQRATAALSGAQTPALAIIGTPVAVNAQTVTFSAQIGDMIVIIGSTNLSSSVSKPAAGGTVPTWIDIDDALGVRITYCVATATNHTSGTWGTSGATNLTAVVLRNQAASPIGGHATSNGTATTVTAPPVTMTKTDGTSVVLDYHATNALSGAAWDVAPAGYTRQAASVQTNSRSCCLNSKNSTTSDGSVNQGTTTTAAYRGATVEILAA